MSDLTNAVNAYSELDNTVVGDEEKGIVISRNESYYALHLDVALIAMKQGSEKMNEVLENDCVDLGGDFEF